MVSTNLYVSSFYFVLIGSIQVETTVAETTAKDDKPRISRSNTSSVVLEKQLLEAEMEAEAAKTGAYADIRERELKLWFTVRAWWSPISGFTPPAVGLDKDN